ncbi:MAG: caspase family protein [Dysgonamonadaceae bacterium]|jgi:tetratricopeptide (TPR) repeat protein|nr:caspase family protein [Dysgonamonadaceae bacterium]
MKTYLSVILFLVSFSGSVRSQNTAETIKKANQLYVFFESERDKGVDIDATYNYLLDSYTQFLKVINASDNGEYINAIKNRLKAAYPYIEKATIYYADVQNNSKVVEFAIPYIEIPKLSLFRSELLPQNAQYASIVYYAGISAYKIQKYNQAIALFQEYLNTDSKEFAKDSYLYLNMIYLAQKSYKEQENILERAHTQFPLVLDFLYNLVNVHITTQNVDKLLATINKILNIDPNNEKVLPIKARLLENAGKNEEALQIYQRLYTLHPDNSELLTGLARSNFNYATEIINNGSTIVDDTQYAIVRQKAAGYLLEAKDLFLKILEKNPTSKQYMTGLASVYQYMDMLPEYTVLSQIITDGVDFGQFTDRLTAYNEAQQKSPEQPQAPNNTFVPRPTNPAQLTIRIDEFSDGNENKVIDAGEVFAVTFTIQNQGQGDAYNVRIRLSEQQGLDTFFDGAKEMDGGNIPAGIAKQYTMRYIVDKNLPEGSAVINIYAFEANGFDADPAELLVTTMDYAMPRLAVADYQFLAAEGTSITLGDNGKLSVAIRNEGSVTANDVKINFKLPNNIYATDNPEILIDSIPPGEVSVIDYQFLVNKRFDQDSISVLMSVTEPTKTSFINDVFKVKLGQYLTSTQTLRLEGQSDRKALAAAKDFSLTLKNELLENVPEGGLNRHRYALIIGNEDYSIAGRNAEINVPYAVNDAIVFREYCLRTFGIPDKQVKFVSNATAGIMHEQLDWLVNMASADSEAELFFFFSGHGNNDEQTKEAFLIPVDVSGKNIRFGISLENLYTELSRYPVKASYVFLDACFSGGFKGEAALVAQKAVRVVPKIGMPRGNTISFSSSSGDQTSSVWHEKKQGYFTYFLVKSIQESNGNITMKSLFEKTNAAVRRATALTGKLQEPQIMVSPVINYDWENLKLQTDSEILLEEAVSTDVSPLD